MGLMGLYKEYVGVVVLLIMEKKMDTTVVY